METDELKEKKQDLGNHASDYLDTLYDLASVTITQKVTNVASRIIVTIIVCALGLFVLFFASLGLAWWLGDIVKSREGGFWIVAGFYLLLILIIAISGRKIFSSFRNRIIRKIYE